MARLRAQWTWGRTARTPAWYKRHSGVAKDWQVRAIWLYTSNMTLVMLCTPGGSATRLVNQWRETCLRRRSKISLPLWRLMRSLPEKEAKEVASSLWGSSDLMEVVLWQNSVAYHCEEYRCMYFICQRLPDVMVHMGQKHNKISLHRSFLTLVEEALQQYEQNALAHR